MQWVTSISDKFIIPLARKITENPRNTFVALTCIALALRLSTFGDPNIHVDEDFYFYVGERMHHGALPYVDVWDRKPLGLFLIYYFIAGISDSVIAYQVIATLFAAATAMAINLIAKDWAGKQAGLFAAVVYLLMLAPLEGVGGQAPVFYNLFIAAAAWLLLRALPDLQQSRVVPAAFGAMALGGLAITIKQTAVFEAAYFGGVAVVTLARSPMPWPKTLRTAALFAVIGAMPTLLISAYYALVGHWYEYWHAMVNSNLQKRYVYSGYFLPRITRLYLSLNPLMFMTIYAAMSGKLTEAKAGNSGFYIGWLVAAILAFLSVPNFYLHYALPMLVPLCITASPALAMKRAGPAIFAFIAVFCLLVQNPVNFRHTNDSKQSMFLMTQAILHHGGDRGLFVFDGPILLYSMTGNIASSPLAFPPHLLEIGENNTSHFGTREEVEKILEHRPGVVVMSSVSRTLLVNKETNQLTKSYVRQNCDLIGNYVWNQYYYRRLLSVYGNCR
ncbi:MAG: hypothetical protein ABIQ66_01495 [Novosphingobium sp.]